MHPARVPFAIPSKFETDDEHTYLILRDETSA